MFFIKVCTVSMLIFSAIQRDLPNKEDLYTIAIPDNAYESEVPMRAQRGVVQLRKYFPKEPSSQFGSPRGDFLEVDKGKIGERRYYENNKLAEEKLFRDGMLHGVWRQYHENGKLFSERPYRMGKPDGTFKFWDEKEKLLGQSVIENGNGILREYKHPYLSSENRTISFVDGKKDGPEVTAAQYSRAKDDQGVRRSIVNYRKDIREGWSAHYWSNNSLQLSLYFHKGTQHGVCRKLDNQGKMEAGYPRYFVSGKEVTEQEYTTAAKTDPILQISLESEGPEPPEQL